MKQFSLLRLFASMTLLSVGMALLAMAANQPRSPARGLDFVLGASFLGAGFLTPFKRTLHGAALGPVIVFVSIVAAGIILGFR